MSRSMKEMTLIELAEIAEPKTKQDNIEEFLDVIRKNETLEVRFVNLKRVNTQWINLFQKTGCVFFYIKSVRDDLNKNDATFPRISMKLYNKEETVYPLLQLEI